MTFVRRIWPALGFAAVTFLGAFLVFQVQPVVSKALLPWFGGSPSVWTNCVLFFQVLLFGGYAYAHLLTSRCPPRWQGVIHLSLVTLSLLMLPIVPGAHWKPTGDEDPSIRILMTLAACVGLPYFLLSSTGPLLQAWYSRSHSAGSPYRLYALSNIGSLLALISYPFLVEPAWAISVQGAFWSLGFCLFAVLCGFLVMCLKSDRTQESAIAADNAAAPESGGSSRSQQRIWLALPGFASVMLLATTNHVCQDVAVVPFLWIAPLSLYLLTFIISFDGERWYSRRWCSAMALLSILGLHLALHFNRELGIVVEVGLCLTAMFFVCLLCHGELVRAKPAPRYLTQFYLLTSAGGAIGGVLVAVVCPLAFDTHFEMPVSFVLGLTLATSVLLSTFQERLTARPQLKFIGRLACFAAVLFVTRVQNEQRGAKPVIAKRNFYGTLCVARTETNTTPGTSLIHGRIIHGFQFEDPQRSQQPTTYYAEESGIGLVLRNLHSDRPLRVGAVGLGCGTVAAFGRKGDYYRFYEINPAVKEIAENCFSYLSASEAKIDIQLGDARLSLEREPPQEFDVLILDAFSGDSVPAHLLTREAFDIYRRHMRPDGVIAVHVSNRHLRLEPVVIRQAEHQKMSCVRVMQRGNPERAVLMSKWMLLTNNVEFLTRPQIASVGQSFGRRSGPEFPLWTDQYNNLFQILNAF